MTAFLDWLMPGLRTEKHLQGQHDQGAHGHRGAGPARSGLARSEAGAGDASQVEGALKATDSGHVTADGRRSLSVYEAAELGETNPLAGEVGDKFYTETMGNSRQDYEAVKKLLSDHGSVQSVQQHADAELVRLYGESSPKGKVLRDIIKTETALLGAYYDGHPKRLQKEIDRLTDDFEFEMKYSRPSRDYFADMKNKLDNRIDALRSFPPPILYRKGDTGKGKIESWTTHSGGAWMGNSGRLAPDKSFDIRDLLSQGYVSLGGIGRMMGAPGESEVTLFKPG